MALRAMIAGQPEPAALRSLPPEPDRSDGHAELLRGVPGRDVLAHGEPRPRAPLGRPGAQAVQADEALARAAHTHAHVHGVGKGARTARLLSAPRHRPLRQPHLLRREAPGKKRRLLYG